MMPGGRLCFACSEKDVVSRGVVGCCELVLAASPLAVLRAVLLYLRVRRSQELEKSDKLVHKRLAFVGHQIVYHPIDMILASALYPHT